MSESDFRNNLYSNPVTAIPAAGFDSLREAYRDQKAAERAAAAQREELAALMAQRPPTMPTADDAAVRRARRRSIAEQMRRRGRQSTILTNPDLSTDALGAS